MDIKDILRKVLISLRLDLTKNLQYDRLTKMILKNTLRTNSNCIDVGCHKGEILELMLQYAPDGTHFAFEPIPYLFDNLKLNYANKAEIFPYALSDKSGKTSFNFVKNAPAYSGIKQRKYDVKVPDIEEIQVELKTIDDVIPSDVKIDFIKIDVEGGEFGVLKGATALLLRDLPTILFESGKGASEFYGTTPQDIHRFITQEIGLNIFTLKEFTKKGKATTEAEFVNYFEMNTEYGFVASK